MKRDRTMTKFGPGMYQMVDTFSLKYLKAYISWIWKRIVVVSSEIA